MVDFHSHILPGVDDGSPDVARSIAMLRMEGEQGITHVVATPHFYPKHDTPEQFLARRDQAEAILREEMEKHTGLPRLSVGAEVHYFRGISESDMVPRLALNSRSILIEMPPAPWPDTAYRELEAIRTQWGITPVLAHIDRYIAPFRTFGIPERMEKLPVLVQANGSFFLEKATASMALRLLKRDRIHLLGSDCHNLTSRKPNLGAAMELIARKLGPEALTRLRRYEALALGVESKECAE